MNILKEEFGHIISIRVSNTCGHDFKSLERHRLSLLNTAMKTMNSVFFLYKYYKQFQGSLKSLLIKLNIMVGP